MYSIPQDGGRRRCSFSLSEIIREKSQCEIPYSTGFLTAARSERNPSLCTAQGVHVELLSLLPEWARPLVLELGRSQERSWRSWKGRGLSDKGRSRLA